MIVSLSLGYIRASGLHLVYTCASGLHHDATHDIGLWHTDDDAIDAALGPTR